ncbi:MAG: hypothetical protein A2032_06600 [Chloroflexi bacterium RBG_19FT_COMBO_49_13]|nr:MAG: hypothetical protein A2032_06600 [Chloroflexi bacterium RBG_19FT_COMBO_49_13]
MDTTLHNLKYKTISILDKAYNLLYQLRLLVLILIATFIIAIEIYEHPNFLTDRSRIFFIEVSIYYAFFLIAALMFELAMRASIAKNQTIIILDARHNLSQKLSAANDWDEVVTRVLQYPSSIAPVMATSFLIYDPVLDVYRTERGWLDSDGENEILSVTMPRDSCCSADYRVMTPEIHMINCETVVKISNNKCLCYHMPLNYGDMPVGILNIITAQSRPLEAEQIQLLSNTAEDIAIGLNAAIQRREQQAIEIANAASNERLEIARDLHDTLGQNLGYLHFKLDQILTEGEKRRKQELHAELDRLRDLANESYELVRNTLVILHHSSEHRIIELFNAHAQIIAKRTGIIVNMNEEGLPRLIPPNNLKQLLFAFKESLYNIEKHSGASQAKVCLSWTNSHLKIRIWDDGCGFEVKDATNDGHYGLHIIDERIRSLGGTAKINSSPGQGTEVVLWLPLIVSDVEKIDMIGEL